MNRTSFRQAFVLAAGLGTRLRPLTHTTPKPLLPINTKGDTCLGIVLSYLHAEKFDRIIVNAYHLPEAIKAFVREHYPHVMVSVETEPFETGGGFMQALPYMNETSPVLVINGDTYLDDRTFTSSLLADFAKGECDLLLGLGAKEKGIAFSGAGDYDFVDEKAERIAYRPNGISAPYTFIGARVTTVPYMRECAKSFGANFSFKKCFDKAEAANRLHGKRYSANWCDLSTVETLEALRDYHA